jgi:dihydroorotate dehydrogenase subfamily 1
MVKDLRVNYCGVDMKNPVIVASGPSARDYLRMKYCVDSGVGAFIAKTVGWTRDQIVYATPRYYVQYPEAVAAGNYYSFYTCGEGCAEFEPAEFYKIIEQIRPYAESKDCRVIVSIMGESEERWQHFAKMFDPLADMFELNFGCVYGGDIAEKAGCIVSQDPDLATAISRAVRRVTRKPIIAKMSAEGGNLIPVCKAVEKEGIEGVTLTHRFSALEVDIENGKPVSNMGFSGYGGPWAAPISRKWVAQVAQSTKLEICGGGGIDGWRDAIAHLMCGAKTFQMCAGPMLRGYEKGFTDTIAGIKSWLDAHDYKSIDEIIGITLKYIVPFPKIPRKDQLEARARIDLDLCTGCGTCAEICLYSGAKMDPSGKVAVIDETNCEGCGLCEQMCPAEAIGIYVRGTERLIPTRWAGARGWIQETARGTKKTDSRSILEIWRDLKLI